MKTNGARAAARVLGASAICRAGVFCSGVGALLLTGSSVQAAFPALDPIVLTGQQVPGAATGDAFGNYIAATSITPNGHIAFDASTSLADDEVFGGTPGNFLSAAIVGGQLPGAPAGVDYSRIPTYSIADSGQMQFYATLAGTGVVTNINDDAVLSGPAGSVQLVARRGDPVPGLTSGTIFGSIYTGNEQVFTFAPILARNNANETLFPSYLGGSPVTASNDQALFSSAAGSVSVVAREGMLARIGTPGAIYTTVTNSPSTGPDGTIAYEASYDGSVTGSALFTGTPAHPIVAVNQGDAVPGFAGATFNNFTGTATVNAADQLEFSTTVSMPSAGGPLAEQGIFVYTPVNGSTPAHVTPVAISNNPSPVPGSNYVSISEGPLSDSGQVFFTATLTGQTGTTLFAGSPSNPHAIAQINIASIADLGKLLYLTHNYENSGNEIAFQGALDNQGDSAIFAVDPFGDITEIAKTGVPLDIGGGIMKTANLLYLDGITDGDQLLINADFSDNTSGLFTVTVPEPTGTAPLLAGAA